MVSVDDPRLQSGDKLHSIVSPISSKVSSERLNEGIGIISGF